MAGRTDRWIFSEMAARLGVTPDADTLEGLERAYVAHLQREIDVPSPDKRVLPGVRPLLDALTNRDDVCVSLLTGNLPAGARIKLEHFGLWHYFDGGGFGHVAAERIALYAAAIESVASTTGVRFAPDQTVIVGDTTHDVAVAVATGARCLAVATGSVAPDALTAAGADMVLQDLSDLPRALAALGVALPSP